MSGNDPDDEELEEVEELERLTSLKDQSLWTKLKKCVLDLVERVGFFGILVCASVSSHSSSLCSLFIVIFRLDNEADASSVDPSSERTAGSWVACVCIWSG